MFRTFGSIASYCSVPSTVMTKYTAQILLAPFTTMDARCAAVDSLKMLSQYFVKQYTYMNTWITRLSTHIAHFLPWHQQPIASLLTYPAPCYRHNPPNLSCQSRSAA